MKAFLHKLALHLKKKHPSGLIDHCIVFPNRRAGVFFKKYFSEVSGKPGWMPEILTIGDLMKSLSGLHPADPLEVSFEAYKNYKFLTGSSESFDEFYLWGEMMVSDFNDIDKYLVNAKQLFTNINDIKEIERVFDYLEPEQKQLISRFWKNFDLKTLSGEKESFLFIWKLLYPLYEKLRTELMERGLGYEGMIYRKVAEEVIEEKDFRWPWAGIILCGFNALSQAEEKLFMKLHNTGIGSFYWDYDNSFVNEKVHEAGRFLRNNIRKFPSDHDFMPDKQEENNERELKVFSLPSDVLQSKQLFDLLDSLPSGGEGYDFQKTAVILGDESILPSVLTSIPESIGRMNITMGFPVSQTPVFSFIDSVLQMQQHFMRRSREQKFYYRDILSILNHQYIKSFYQEKSDSLVRNIHRQNMIYIAEEELHKDELFSELFRKISSVDEFCNYFLDLFRLLLQLFPEKDPAFKIEKEYLFHIRTRLNKLKNLFEDQNPELSTESFIRLFRKILKNFRIPFEGEPLQGIQIMGILESRLLDFENLIILSMNEGVMPKTGSDSSYIPANLRYAFGMPVKEDRDAIYSYYFYRLLIRAKNVNILYNSRTEGLYSGEPSRYVNQLRYLSNWKVRETTRSFLVLDKESVDICIEKSDEIMNLLERYTDPEGKHFLSPSAFTTYMDCSLRFYFSYVAGIKEEDEASEEIDASGFGSLYHKTMELIYFDYREIELTKSILDSIRDKKNIRKHLDQAFRELFLKTIDQKVSVKPEGRNIIIYEIIQRIVAKTLEVDSSYAPFRLLATEQNIHNMSLEIEGSKKVHTGGLIDRIDLRNGSSRVVDYKTGQVSQEFSGLEKIFNRDSWGNNDNLKGIFQTFMYSWLYTAQNPGTDPVIPSIYQSRKLFIDDFTPYIHDKTGMKDVMNFHEYSADFERKLGLLTTEIFDRKTFFSQTHDEQRCKFCPYNEICHRG